MHFVSRKEGKIETFFCDLWDVDIPKIRDKRSWYKFGNFCKVNLHFNG